MGGRRWLRIAAWSALVVVSWPVPARAQTTRPPLITDRPDFTESSDVVPARWLQLETGVTFESDGSQALRTRAVRSPQALIRLGLGFRTELRVGGSDYVTEHVESGRTAGFGDVTLAVKVRLLDESRAGFDMAVIPIVSLPTGGAGFSSDGVDPTVKVTWSRSLPWGFGIAGNVNVAWITEQDSHFTQEAVSVSIGRDLGRGWSGFAEFYGLSSMTRDEGAGVTFNGGVTRAFADRFQIDLEAGRALTREAPDWFVGAGFAFLMPTWKR